MICSTVLILASSIAVANAANDWTKPCFDGTCEWSIPNTQGSASGSLKIWGSTNAISDITTAAGWEILDCSSDATQQDIRLVCQDTSAGCDNLYANTGAEGKLVRLPNSCGPQPFARVAKAWVPEDQSIPSSVAKRLVRRDGTTPQVKALSLDTQWHLIDTSKNGPINFALSGSNAPGAKEPTTTSATSATRRQILRRFGLGDVINGVESAASAAGSAIENAGDAVVSKAKGVVSEATSAVVSAATAAVGAVDNAASAAASAVGSAVDGVESAASSALGGLLDGAATASAPKNFTNTVTLPPINVDKKVNLFNNSISCGDTKLALSVDANAQINALATVTVDASGTLVPPVVDSFSLVGRMNGTISGDITLGGDLTGSLDTGKIPIFQAGIPGFDFPGILTVGPSFAVNVQGVATLGVSADVKVGLNYNLNDITLVFPPGSAGDEQSGADVAPVDTPLSFSVVPSVTPDAKITGHLIPTLQVGVSALNSQANANIFLNLDASISADLSATLQDAVTVSRRYNRYKPRPLANRVLAIGNAKRANVTTSGVQFGGCGTVGAGIAVNAGADAKFFGIFDQSTSVPLFSKNFQLFQKCFGDKATRSLPARRIISKRDDLTCPAGNDAATKTPLTDATVVADVIKAL